MGKRCVCNIIFAPHLLLWTAVAAAAPSPQAVALVPAPSSSYTPAMQLGGPPHHPVYTSQAHRPPHQNYMTSLAADTYIHCTRICVTHTVHYL